jgi:hypothetical protein
MRYAVSMSKFSAVFLCFLVIGSSMPKVNPFHKPKIKPDQVGIDKEILVFEKMYALDAAMRGIKFKKHVTIGFSLIKKKKGKGTVVGLCTYGKKFREIDVDSQYWHESTWTSKRSLIYHEMTHCFCGRGHTFNDGIYPEADDLPKGPFFMIEPGYLQDGCPMSIMYPYILSDECVAKHWEMYDQEMFESCYPY